jgi:hypothetical protein
MAADSTVPATVDSAEVLSVFEAALSDEEEGAAPAETPAADPPVAQADDEPGSEQGESEEAASPEQEEKSEEEQGEEPAPVALDPNLKVRVKVAGEEKEVTLDELQKGYSRTEDYTRKTQEVAAQRKALESETVAARTERQQLAQHLKLLEETVTELTPKEPDWEAIRRDHPNDFARVWSEWQQAEKDRAQISQQRQEAEARVRKDQEDAYKEHVKTEQEKLYAAIPEWSKEDVRKSEAKAMAEYAQSLGFTPENLAQVSDHRVLLMLRKAMLHDKAQAAKPALIQRVQTKVTATTKPGSAPVSRTPQTNLQKALSRLAKDRTQDAAASVFEAALDD